MSFENLKFNWTNDPNSKLWVSKYALSIQENTFIIQKVTCSIIKEYTYSSMQDRPALIYTVADIDE